MYEGCTRGNIAVGSCRPQRLLGAFVLAALVRWTASAGERGLLQRLLVFVFLWTRHSHSLVHVSRQRRLRPHLLIRVYQTRTAELASPKSRYASLTTPTHTSP